MSAADNKLDAAALEARNRLFKQALAAEEKQDYKKALEYYRMSLQIDVKFFDSWLNAGALYSRQGKSAKAIECYQRALQSRQDKRALYNLASEFFKIARYEETKKLLQQALKQDRHFLQAHLLLGYAYGKTSENEKAEISIKNALKIEPENRPAITALALLYFHSGKKELALKYVDMLLLKDPDDIVMQRLRANLTLDTGDIASAIATMRKIAARDSRLKSFYSSVQQNMSAEQVRELQEKRRVLEQQPVKTEKDMLDLSLLAFFAGDSDKALGYLLQATEKK